MRFFTKLWAYSKLGKFFDRVVGGGSLTAPDLVSPTDGYVTADMTETFECTDVAGATLYRFQLASDATFTIIVETGTSATSDYTSTGMTTGQTYFWRMRAENGAIVSAWTAGWTIKTLGDVILDTPADTSFTSDTTPTFAWFAASNASGYMSSQ